MQPEAIKDNHFRLDHIPFFITRTKINTGLKLGAVAIKHAIVIISLSGERMTYLEYSSTCRSLGHPSTS